MTVSPTLLRADAEMKRFIREQYHNHLGYPKICSFARNLSRGSISLPPPTEDDPVLDCIGAFYISLMPIEKRALFERYSGDGAVRQRARRVSKSVAGFYRFTNKILWRCHYWLLERGH